MDRYSVNAKASHNQAKNRRTNEYHRIRERRHEGCRHARQPSRSEEHTSELQSHVNLVCRLLLEKKNNIDSGRGTSDESGRMALEIPSRVIIPLRASTP